MYSVLIQNQRTIDCFRQYYPLFSQVMKDGTVDICQWMEAGETIDTAIPGIYNKISGKEQWRAVIICADDEGCTTAFTTRPENPFDFLVNASDDGKPLESMVPLIRLTQMLGGVPVPRVRFESEMLEEEYKEPRKIYFPVIDDSEREEYDRLREKYHFYGKPPEEIILVAIRRTAGKNDEEIRRAWQTYRETDSSNFWKRNNYPGICRFTFFDMEQQGDVQRNADFFRFWTAVLLLATNRIDPSTFQAYMLHHLDVEFDDRIMRDTMQETVNRSLVAKQCIIKSLQRELEHKASEEGRELPEYSVTAPVVVKLPPDTTFEVGAGGFGLAAESTTADMEKWDKLRENVDKSLDVLSVCADRALDQTSSRVRPLCTYESSRIKELNDYQREDLSHELDRLYDKILDARSELPENNRDARSRLDGLDKRVRNKIRERTTSHQAFLGYFIAAGVMLACLVSALLANKTIGWGSPQYLLYFAAGACGLFAIGELAALLVSRSALRERITAFNSCSRGFAVNMTTKSSCFSKYMSGMATYMKGCSYLAQLDKLKTSGDEKKFYKQDHITALDSFLSAIKGWCTAFYLPVSFDELGVDDGIDIDTDIAPQTNPIYTFENGKSYIIPLNHTGDTVEAPFAFISRLDITREELYDDAG